MSHHHHSEQADPAWTAVDAYVESLLIPADPALEMAQRDADAAGMPPIAVSPAQGKMLMLLAMALRAERVLEIGTLAGCSTIWLGRGVAARNGRVVTLEHDPTHARVARANIERAGLAGTVEVVEGTALETLPKIGERGIGPFDLVFIDADKEHYAAYLDWSIRLSRRGAVIIADNVVREGAVLDETHTDPRAQGARAFNAALARDPRVEATIVQTVGCKKWDGFAMAVVK